MTWILIILLGISSTGEVDRVSSQYPDKETCLEALGAMRLASPSGSGGIVAFCAPEG
jgi:hypothetical protein